MLCLCVCCVRGREVEQRCSAVSSAWPLPCALRAVPFELSERQLAFAVRKAKPPFCACAVYAQSLTCLFLPAGC